METERLLRSRKGRLMTIDELRKQSGIDKY
jgi:hypothetical protein